LKEENVRIRFSQPWENYTIGFKERNKEGEKSALTLAMGKASKASKKFASSGQLKKTIQARHKFQAIRKKIQGRKRSKVGKQRLATDNADTSAEDDEGEEDRNADAGKLPPSTKRCVLSDLNFTSTHYQTE